MTAPSPGTNPPPALLPGPDDLPDLRAVIATDEAASAAQALVDEHLATGEPRHVGSLTDEELVVCTGSVDGARPTGRWYDTLGETPRRIAETAALRSLTSREELLLIMRGEEVDVSISDRLTALLRLRASAPLMTAQAMTREGPTWYLLRRCGDAWLREVVSASGLHTHDLVRLGDDEELFLRGFLLLLDHNVASDLTALHQPGGGAPPPGEVVSFLATQRHVTQLALVHPPDDAVEALVVCVDETGATTLGVTDGEGVTYRGAAPEAILDRWRTWRDGREQTAGTDV